MSGWLYPPRPDLAGLLHRRPELRQVFPVAAALTDGIRWNT